MDDYDDAMLSLALQDAYPGVLFIDGETTLREPVLSVRPSLAECCLLAAVYFVEPGWEPVFGPSIRFTGWHRVVNLPQRILFYTRCWWFWGQWGITDRWAFSLPTPEAGHMRVDCDPQDEDDDGFVKSLFGLLDRLTSDYLKSGIERDVFRSVRDRKPGHGGGRAGYHVLEWCRAEPRRMLNGTLLPFDDWEPPDTPWLRDLRERVVALYGPDFGGPPDPPEPHTGPGADFVGFWPQPRPE